MTIAYDPVALADAFERALGDPRDPDRAFSTSRVLELDRAEEFPEDIVAELHACGLLAHYVPEEYGGRLRNYEELLQIVRRVAARDLTTAIGHAATYLGAVCTWVAGTPEQAAATGREVMAGTVHSFGLTERNHGSDILAGEVTAAASPGRYRLDGEKWLINNATRGCRLCVLARTETDGGSRGFSLFTVDKRDLSPDTYRTLPAVRTHGIRGTDISGIAFTGASVPAGAMIGAPGEGAEIVLKSLQLTRTLCAALSLGSADHALRLALEQTRPGEDPAVTAVLADAYADLLTVEAVSTVAARSLHALTGELSILSAVVKHFVPTTVDAMIERLTGVLGAEAYTADGAFQKVARDHRIVGIFDGNTVVNLLAVVNQFGMLVRGRRRGTFDAAGLAAATTLGSAPPAFDRDRLSLMSLRGCTFTQAPLDDAVPHAAELRRISDDLHDEMARMRPSARDTPPEAFDLAERYALLFAAFACAQLWSHNRDRWPDSSRLEVSLARLLARLGHPVETVGTDSLLPELLRRHDGGGATP
ncbi:acyl-CoA dehydrogenase family protein [Streptomyces sp. NBC_01207]|uniref:acyl-CoA dehydrogenase family protein n=1 Tax=Streptomyces sp. NBC_01207 TaxID=2903772 RepID=UPI002E13795B|nr:acyl-CoA dehydrogenase [Streptomyces sp. NBC_01207]